MSVVASSPAVPYEPFGQAGVRQYAGRLIAWLCVTVSLSAAAMTHRSGRFFDEVEWRGTGQTMRIVSAYGQVGVVMATNPRAAKEESAWRYRGGYTSGWGVSRRAWQSALGESVGIEARALPPSREHTGGYGLRLKWPTLAAVFMIQPVAYLFQLWRRRRANADDAA